MKERKLKKYRGMFVCPHLIKEIQLVTCDPYQIYQEDTYCKLGRYSKCGYSGYRPAESGTSCDKCKLPITRKQMNDINLAYKKIKRLEKELDHAIGAGRPDKIDECYLKVESFWYEWFNPKTMIYD